jgi:hypothetical protein
MAKDVKYSVMAFVGGVLVMGLLIFLSLNFEQADWMKWFGLALWTGVIFGLVAYKFGKAVSRGKCLWLFVAMLALHIAAMVEYLRFVDKFPNVFFLLFSPVEAGIIALVLSLVNDVNLRHGDAVERPGRRK